MSALEWRGWCRYEDDICGLELQRHCSCWRLQCCQRSLRQEAAFLRPPRWLQHCQRDSARWPHYVRRPDTELVFTSFQFLCVSECPDDGFLTKWPLLKCLIKICWYALTLDSETGHCRGCQSRFCFIFYFRLPSLTLSLTRYRPGAVRWYARRRWQFDGGISIHLQSGHQYLHVHCGRSMSVCWRVRSPHISGDRQWLSCRQPACL